MNKITKILLSGIISIIIVYYGYSFCRFFVYGHKTEMGNFKRYIWLFKDSAKSEIDSIFCAGEVKKRDIYFDYIYKQEYFISIWEFKDLNYMNINDISINENVDLGDVKFNEYEIFNKNSWPQITSKLNFSFNHLLGVNLDKSSKILNPLRSPYFNGFYGVINQMSFSDENKKHLILFDYPSGNEPTIVLFYKTSKSFYTIIINSKNKKFDDSIIDIFNFVKQ